MMVFIIVLLLKMLIFFCKVVELNGWFIVGMKFSSLLSGCKIIVNSVIKCGMVMLGIFVRFLIWCCYILLVFSFKIIWIFVMINL